MIEEGIESPPDYEERNYEYNIEDTKPRNKTIEAKITGMRERIKIEIEGIRKRNEESYSLDDPRREIEKMETLNNTIKKDVKGILDEFKTSFAENYKIPIKSTLADLKDSKEIFLEHQERLAGSVSSFENLMEASKARVLSLLETFQRVDSNIQN